MTELQFKGTINKADVAITASRLDVLETQTITSTDATNWEMNFQGEADKEYIVTADDGTAGIGEELPCYIEKPLLLPIVPTDYQLYYNTENVSPSEGINSGALGSSFHEASASAEFNSSGFVTGASSDSAYFDTPSGGAARYISNLTLMARVTIPSPHVGWVVTCSQGGESPDTNFLYALEIRTDAVVSFHEHGVGSNVTIVGATTFTNGETAIVEIVRTDNGDNTCDIEIFKNGISLIVATNQPNPEIGLSPEQLFRVGASNGQTAQTNGFIGATHKFIVDNRVIPTEERERIRNEWEVTT